MQNVLLISFAGFLGGMTTKLGKLSGFNLAKP